MCPFPYGINSATGFPWKKISNFHSPDVVLGFLVSHVPCEPTSSAQSVSAGGAAARRRGCGWVQAVLFTSEGRSPTGRQLMTLQICSSPVIRELNHSSLLAYHNHLSHRQFILVLSDFRVLLLMLLMAGTRFCFSTETSPWALPMVKFTRNK